ncbi:MAG TPA: DUF5667 domain-containing protein [Candidatus Paceibacterota bacterium]|jgi:hypothetical protein|nr:DUF5667 domain-containing protein [Candidatus Paceibacterota bacterium]
MNDEWQDRFRALSELEKAAVREELRVFMRDHPAQVPFSVRFFERFDSAIYNPRVQFTSAAVALVLAAGTGTAFAAQNALPGEPLYGVKVNVEEPILGSLATSPEAQADWNARLAAQRLSEAVQLAAQNKLTPAAASTIAGGLDQAAENFDANVAHLATSSSNAATVATLTSNMEATFAANTQVMAELQNIVPNAAANLAPILSRVQERAVSLNNARTQFDKATQANSGQARAAAQTALSSAQQQVNQVTAKVVQTRSATSSSASWQAEQAQVEIQSGKENLAAGNYMAALETLQAATVEAQAAQINISIGEQLSSATGIQLPATSSVPAAFGQTEATSTVNTSTVIQPRVRSRHDQ